MNESNKNSLLITVKLEGRNSKAKSERSERKLAVKDIPLKNKRLIFSHISV